MCSIFINEEQVGSVLPIDQRLAIWMSSKVMMHTPIREGLNMCPLEYVFVRKEPADPGVVIASEFSAVSAVLNGALRVNPYDVQMCVTSIDCALSMSFNERDARRGRDIDFGTLDYPENYYRCVLLYLLTILTGKCQPVRAGYGREMFSEI